MDVNEMIDKNNAVPITFALRGTAINKMTPDEIAKRGYDSMQYIITLGFVLEMLNYHGFDSLARKVEANEMSYHFSAIGGMMQEFASETIEVIASLDDEIKEQTKRRDKYRDDLYKLEQANLKKTNKKVK